MRTDRSLSIVAALLLCACAHGSTQSTTSDNATPDPLVSCETRLLTVDGVDLQLDANIDDSLGDVIVLDAPDTESRDRALDAVRHDFGEAKPDVRTETRPWRLGLTRLTDMCGRPVARPSSMPSATPSPG